MPFAHKKHSLRVWGFLISHDSTILDWATPQGHRNGLAAFFCRVLGIEIQTSLWFDPHGSWKCHHKTPPSSQTFCHPLRYKSRITIKTTGFQPGRLPTRTLNICVPSLRPQVIGKSHRVPPCGQESAGTHELQAKLQLLRSGCDPPRPMISSGSHIAPAGNTCSSRSWRTNHRQGFLWCFRSVPSFEHTIFQWVNPL